MSNHKHHKNTHQVEAKVQTTVEVAKPVDHDAEIMAELAAVETELVADQAQLDGILNVSEEDLEKKSPEEIQNDIKTLESALSNPNAKAVQHVQNIAEKMVEQIRQSAQTVISDIERLEKDPTPDQINSLNGAKLLLANIDDFENQTTLILKLPELVKPGLEITLGLVKLEYEKVAHFARTKKLKVFDGFGILIDKLHEVKPEGRKFMQNKVDFMYFFLKYINANRKEVMENKLVYVKLTSQILTVSFSTAADVFFVNKVCDYYRSMK
jgi:hypothetical protein